MLTGVCMAVIWLSQSLRLIDLCINRGVSVWVFFKMINMLIPDFLSIILPISVFIATLVVYQRLIQGREIFVLRSAGLSDLQLSKPALLWGTMITVFLYTLNLYILPLTYRSFRELEHSLKQAGASLVLPAGEFTHLSTMTAYIHHQEKGELQGIIIYNEHKEKPMFVVAKKGKIYNEGTKTYLVMTQGTHQEKDLQTGKISVLYFDDFIYNLNAEKPRYKNRELKPHEQFLMDLLRFENPLDIIKKNKHLSEAHQRLIKPLLSLNFVLLALVCLLRRRYNRYGQAKSILLAGGLMVGIQVLSLSMAQIMVKHPHLAILYYILTLFPILGGILLLAKNRPFLFFVKKGPR
jgi:lipopolysaccharide export system permease protein